MKKLSGIVTIALLTVLLVSCGLGGGREISLIPVENGDEFQYIDKEGKIVINPQFSAATVFRNGIALVRTTGNKSLWGYINEEGKYSIQPSFKEATIFSEDLAWVVSENGAPTAINTKGEIKITLQDAETVRIFQEGLAAFSVTEDSKTKWGFVDKDGRVAISPQFAATDNFAGGKCAVQNEEGKWGYIDSEGKIAITYQFDEAEKFVNGQAAVKFDGKAGAIDEAGKYVINPQFDGIAEDGELYLIEQNEKYGWATREGQIVINPQFVTAFTFNGGKIAPVQVGETWGYVDKEGKIVINPQFKVALPFISGVAAVLSGEKVGFVDAEGKYIINPQYDGISEDMLNYIIDGSSSYESVDTDFFNIAPIVARINLNTPEGLTLASTLGDVVTKLNLTEEVFSEYTTQHTVLEDVAITNDASLDFSVWASSHNEIPDGWYIISVFNGAAPVQGYVYTFNLSGRGADKAENVVAAIEKTITGMQKDEVESAEEGYIVYKNATQNVYLQSSGSQVIVTILKANQVEESGD
jgi:uncharacterized protein YbdZ (MbtH family)